MGGQTQPRRHPRSHRRAEAAFVPYPVRCDRAWRSLRARPRRLLRRPRRTHSRASGFGAVDTPPEGDSRPMRKLLFGLAAASIAIAPATAALKVGDKAPDFTTTGAVGGKEFKIHLADQLKKGPVVLYFF